MWDIGVVYNSNDSLRACGCQQLCSWYYTSTSTWKGGGFSSSDPMPRKDIMIFAQLSGNSEVAALSDSIYSGY